MKLRNKKTGGIGWLETYYGKNGEKKIAVLDKKSEYHPYNSLAELNEEWEDYEETKSTIKDVWFNSTIANGHFVEIDFISDEEAEKAVEKIKAWKRLENKGFRFKGIEKTYLEMDCIEFDIGSEYLRERDLRGSELNKDLDLLFGGEE